MGGRTNTLCQVEEKNKVPPIMLKLHINTIPKTKQKISKACCILSDEPNSRRYTILKIKTHQ